MLISLSIISLRNTAILGMCRHLKRLDIQPNNEALDLVYESHGDVQNSLNFSKAFMIVLLVKQALPDKYVHCRKPTNLLTAGFMTAGSVGRVRQLMTGT